MSNKRWITRRIAAGLMASLMVLTSMPAPLSAADVFVEGEGAGEELLVSSENYAEVAEETTLSDEEAAVFSSSDFAEGAEMAGEETVEEETEPDEETLEALLAADDLFGGDVVDPFEETEAAQEGTGEEEAAPAEDGEEAAPEALESLPEEAQVLEEEAAAEEAQEDLLIAAEEAEETEPVYEEFFSSAEEASVGESLSNAVEFSADEDDEDFTADDETADWPAASFTDRNDSRNITVRVSAKKGTFPAGTTMKVTDASQDAVEKITSEAQDLVEGDVVTVVAVDISFYDAEGNKIEPRREVSVSITPNRVTKAELADADSLALVHLPDETPEEPAAATELVADDQINGTVTAQGVSFTSDAFSVYAVIGVDESALHYEMELGGSKVTVSAPSGAFETGTEMIISSVDPDELLKVVAALGTDATYSFNAIDISFYKDGAEVEPALPVEVTWESAAIDAADEQLLHLKDDGTVEKMTDAFITDGKVEFTATSFSTYTTTRLSQIDMTKAYAQAIVFEPDTLTRPATMDSGELSSTAPTFEGYTFDYAYYTKDGVSYLEDEEKIIYLGAFDYQEEGQAKQTFIYYRTKKTAGDSDLIVKLAENETVHLVYKTTPILVTYQVVYNGTTYTLENGNLPANLITALGDDASALEIHGPASVERSTMIPQAITVNLPRGYQAAVTRRNTPNGAVSDLGNIGTEPTYSVSADNKTITQNGANVDVSGVFDFPAVTQAQTVTINLTKRPSFTFNARYFLATVYAGGAGINTLGDSSIADNNGNKARITSDSGTITTSGSNRGTGTITDHTYTWSFWTNREVQDDIGAYNDRWMIDALEINGTTIEIPYAETVSGSGVSKTTTLPSGTQITVTLDQITYESGNYTGRRRHYTITVSNAYENVVITGGNIINTASSTEIIAEVLENVEYAFYGYSSGDSAHSNTGLGWQTWGVGEPISVGNTSGGNGNYNMYGFNRTNNSAMRFSVPTGYYNPEIAFVSTTETDLISNVTLGSGLSRGTKVDGYYPINGNPTNGYYYFQISGITVGNTRYTPALLRIRASLMRYGVSYDVGTDGPAAASATIPAYDYGGWYDDAKTQLRGYNIEDNDYVVLADSAPVDNSKEYVFMYYTINGDRTDTHYAPSQKIPLEDIAQYGVYDNEKGEFVIPFVAHWERKETSEMIPMTAVIYLDDELETEVTEDGMVTTMVPKRSSVYIDIDSDTMVEIMDHYYWQLFYDEMGSSPFVREITEENNQIEIRLYSKFYVYNSGTDELELHTTKEAEKGEGDERYIDTIDLYKYHDPADGLLYGGVYFDYSEAATVKAAADYDNEHGTLSTAQIVALSGKEGVLIKSGVGAKYEPDKNKLQSWNSSYAYTAPGTEKTRVVKPERAKIYYVKEVPTTFLRPYFHYVYNVNTKVVDAVYLATVVDDYNYNDIGGLDGTYGFGSILYLGEKFTFRNAANTHTVFITTDNPFANAEGAAGYVGLWKMSSFNGVTVRPYHVTPDGEKVFGTAAWTINKGDGKYYESGSAGGVTYTVNENP